MAARPLRGTSVPIKCPVQGSSVSGTLPSLLRVIDGGQQPALKTGESGVGAAARARAAVVVVPSQVTPAAAAAAMPQEQTGGVAHPTSATAPNTGHYYFAIIRRCPAPARQSSRSRIPGASRRSGGSIATSPWPPLSAVDYSTPRSASDAGIAPGSARKKRSG